ncbi:nucleotidyl transferase AbiEii/AbiGii toxin family protein [Galbibacter orientalis]|uniref:nucleotidyl transferase AbiEii/AbiGii toxin family protein n=1 Tax=Galbibacter orientalis TaxID=453852 RepID=UPI00307FF8BB
MKLHENKKLFTQAVRFTAQEMDIRDVYIEKDYWITYALYTIFTHEIGKEAVFKGGTALSKCFGLIDRFSEDIDLVVLRNEGDSGNKLTNKIKKISKVVSSVLNEVELENVTQKMGMNRKTAHSYNKEFKGDYGQVRDVIIVEATWLGYFEPYTEKMVNSYVYDMMKNTGQLQMISEYGLEPFEVKVLDPKRTLCEKIMSLVRFSYEENAIEDLKKKIRHTYDLCLMLQNEGLSKFFYSRAFESMLLKVANDDVESFKNNNAWLVYHPNEALIFSNLKNVWSQLKNIYSGNFRKLVYTNGRFPNESEVEEALMKIKERLSSIPWDIKI